MITSNAIIKTLKQYEPRSLHHELDVVWDWAEGYEVGSIEVHHASNLINFVPKTYIDFTSGIFVANIGHGNEHVIRAIVKQLSKPLLHTYTFPNEARAQLVEKLCKMTGFEKCFLCSTGSEAIEVVFKMMTKRRPSMETAPKYLVCSFQGQNHGHTLVGDVLSGRRHYTVGNRLPIYQFHDMATFRQNRGVGSPMAGIFIESYHGWNAQFYAQDDIQELCQWAQENQIPVCFDEIQAGFGRTGKMFGYEHYGVKPDFIVVGKGLSSSLPLAAVLGRADFMDNTDDLSSTHTGNPICCAAALATLEVLEQEHLVEKAAEMGQRIQPYLNAQFLEYQVNGKGMVWAIDLKDIDFANKVVKKCAEKGLLLVKTHRGTIKIGAPLIMPWEVMKQGIDIIRESVTECISDT